MLSQDEKVANWVEAVAQRATAYVEETRALLGRPAMEAMPSQAQLYRQALERVEALLARRPEFLPGPAYSLADRRTVEAWAGEVEDALSHYSARGGNRER